MPYFPHQVSDLGTALSYMEYLEKAHREFWTTRYLVLLWLSLICRLPFDLTNFDDELSGSVSTADAVENLGRRHLDKAGLEKDGAALLLARLYSRYGYNLSVVHTLILRRQDTCTRLPSFLSWCTPTLTESSDLLKAR